MTFALSNSRAAYYVTGAGVEPGKLTDDLTEALTAADEVNQQIGVAAGSLGPAFVIAVMAIDYPDAVVPPADEPVDGTTDPTDDTAGPPPDGTATTPSTGDAGAADEDAPPAAADPDEGTTTGGTA